MSRCYLCGHDLIEGEKVLCDRCQDTYSQEPNQPEHMAQSGRGLKTVTMPILGRRARQVSDAEVARLTRKVRDRLRYEWTGR